MDINNNLENITSDEEIIDIGDVPVTDDKEENLIRSSREKNNANLYESINADNREEKSTIIEEVPLSKEQLEVEAAKLPKGSIHIYDDQKLKKSTPIKSFIHCMTHDMQKENLLKKYGDPTSLSAKEKSHYEQELFSLSPVNQLKRTMQNRSLGAARYFLAFTEFARAAIKKVQAKFTALGEMIDEYAKGNSANFVQKSNLNLEPKKEFIDKEMEAVTNYQSLIQENKHREAEAILQKRQIDRKDFALQLLKGNDLSPEVKKMYDAYQELEGKSLDMDFVLSEVEPKTLYESPVYLQNLSFLKTRFESIDRFEESIHNNQSDADKYKENIESLNNEYKQANKDLLDELGFIPREVKEDLVPEKVNEFLMTEDIDNGVEKNNFETVNDELEL